MPSWRAGVDLGGKLFLGRRMKPELGAEAVGLEVELELGLV